MDRISAVSFDLDGTLIRYVRSPGEVLAASFERLDMDPLFDVQAYYDRYDEFAEQTESMDELRRECFAALADANGHDPERGREVASAFADERDQSNVELVPGAKAVLDRYSEAYDLAVVTNGVLDAQLAKIDAVGIERWVDTIVVAGHDTPPKPDPDPIERAIEALGASPATTVHIGDTLGSDIAGATAAGVDSVWVGDGDELDGYDPTYTVDSLEELLTPPWEPAMELG